MFSRRRRSFGNKRKQVNKQIFVGRDKQLEQFKNNIELGPDSPEFYNIFNVFGQGGVGKTTLLTRYHLIAKNAGYLTSFIDTEDQRLYDVLATMNAIAENFDKQDAPFKQFTKRYKNYLQEKGKLETDPERPKGTLGKMVKGGIKMSAKIGIDSIPGTSLISDYVPIDTIADAAEDWTNFVSKKLSNKDEIELVLTPLKVLTPLWIEDLYNYADKQPSALFFDTYEIANPELDNWLFDLLNENYGEIPDNILLCIGGRDILNPNKWNIFKEDIIKISLKEFEKQEARQYLEKRGMTSQTDINAIMSISGCLPIYLSLLTESSLESPNNISDPSEKIVERFLKHIKEPINRQLALQAALPRKLNKDIIATLIPSKKDAEGLFNWLKNRPFVQKRGGHWAYHPIVRTTMLRYQKEISETDWEKIHLELANWYQERATRIEISENSDKWFEDELWRLLQVEKLFHLLCANYKKHISQVIQFFATIVRLGDYKHAIPLITTLIEVEKFHITPIWGSILKKGISAMMANKSDGFLELFEKINRADYLIQKNNKSYFHLKQGSYEEDPDKAIIQIKEAIKIEPEYAEAYNKWGLVVHKQHEFEKAIEKYKKAIELKSDYGEAYNNQGAALISLNMFDKALLQFQKAIELGYDSYSNLGLLLSYQGKFNEAEAQYKRAMEQTPVVIGVYYNYGNLLYENRNLREAKIYYEKAIELNYIAAGLYTNYGNLLQEEGNIEKAFTYHKKAIELNPNMPEVYHNYGNTLYRQRKLEVALIQYSNAIKLNPKFAASYNSYGVILQEQGKLEEARKYHEKSIKLNPHDAGVHNNLGNVLASQGKYNMALNSYQKAVELVSGFALAYSNYGVVLQKQKKYEESLSYLQKAIELEPKLAVAYTHLGNLLLELGKNEEAKEQYDIAEQLKAG